MSETARTITAPTWVAICLGGSAAGFGAFGLGIVVLQRLMLANMPEPELLPNGASFSDAMNALHWVWFVHLPIWIAGGLVLTASGWAYHRQRRWALGAIRMCCVLALVELIAYTIHAWVGVMPTWKPLFALHPMVGSNFEGFMVVSGVVSLVLVGAPFALLWWLTTRPRADGSQAPGQAPTHA